MRFSRELLVSTPALIRDLRETPDPEKSLRLAKKLPPVLQETLRRRDAEAADRIVATDLKRAKIVLLSQ